MIQNEILSDGRIRHYSDTGYKIRQVETDVVYADAVDVMPCRYTYVETNEPVDVEDIPAEEALAIITGGAM